MIFWLVPVDFIAALRVVIVTNDLLQPSSSASRSHTTSRNSFHMVAIGTAMRCVSLCEFWSNFGKDTGGLFARRATTC